MATPLRVLLVEDSAIDAELVVDELVRAGYEPAHERVDDRAGLVEALERGGWDVLVSDHGLRDFNSLEVIEIVREQELDLPVIVVSGTLGEESAVEIMKAGARDLLIKDRLERLAPVVARELAEAERRREHRRADEELRQSRESFRAIVENSRDLNVLVDALGRVVYASPSHEQVLGYKPVDLVGRQGLDLVHPDDRAAAEAALAEALEGGLPFISEFRLRRRDGGWLHFEGAGAAIPGETPDTMLVLGTLRDITERLRSEAALRESEERFRTIFESAAIGICITDRDSRVVRSNAAFREMVGLSEEELRAVPFSAYTHPDDLPGNLALWDELLAGKRETYEVEKRYLRTDGRLVWGHLKAAAVRDTEGQPSLFFTMVQDVTEHRRAEEVLRDSAEQYRLLFESNPHPMWVCDAETLAFLAVNDAAVRQYGYSAEEFLAMTIKEIRPEEDVARLLAELPEGLQAPKSWGTWRHRKKDGTVFDVETTSAPIPFAGRRAALVLATDVSERTRLEEALRQSQKLEAVGRLAGGIAHDFNNLLTVITGYSGLIEGHLGDAQRVRGDVGEISRAADRAASLTRQLLAFSRKQVLQPRVLDLNTVVSDLTVMLGRLLGEDVELVCLLDPELGRVRADPGQLEQVIVNLAVNARDAMPDGGTLTIETRAALLDEASARAHPSLRFGPCALLRVVDTGHGMDAETLSHVFEPFFTTKGEAEGTGLGLATAYGIVAQSGGAITVSSEPGRGATFNVYLPQVETGEGGEERPARPAGDPLLGSETVLLVEDDDAVRGLVRRILEQRGYAVLAATEGSEALELARRFEGPIELLLTDTIMPGMNGPELAGRLRPLRPETRVLFVSGYTDTALARHGVLEDGVAFLYKPFGPEALARKVREVLDAPA